MAINNWTNYRKHLYTEYSHNPLEYRKHTDAQASMAIHHWNIENTDTPVCMAIHHWNIENTDAPECVCVCTTEISKTLIHQYAWPYTTGL